MYVQLLMLCSLNIFILDAIAEEFPCKSTETSLTSLVNATLSAKELPPDLPMFVVNISNPDVCLTVQNVSNILTLRRFLYNHTTRSYGNDLQRRYFTTLYAYVEFKHTILNASRYIPRNHSDILILVNAFSSSNVSPMLGKKVYSYFSSYENWTDTLVESKFPFGSYKDPRSLLLGMICALVKQSKRSLHEREALLFMLASSYNCCLDNGLDNSKWPIDQGTSSDNKTRGEPNTKGSLYVIQLPTIDQANGSKVGISNYSSQGEVMGNLPKMMFNASVLTSVGLKRSKGGDGNYSYSKIEKRPDNNLSKEITTFSTIDIAKTITSAATTANLLNASTLAPISEIPATTVSLSKSSSFLPAQTAANTSNLKDVDDLVVFNFSSSRGNSPDDYILQPNGSTDMLAIDIRNVGELDGLCKEGQQYLVKLHVQSLLTAIDKGVPRVSLELFLKLLPTIRQFPIQDYNARGQLLRDLVPAISKQHADPFVKRKMNDILSHVILDGVGALPPKIKLECSTITARELERFRRRTKRVFRIQYE